MTQTNTVPDQGVTLETINAKLDALAEEIAVLREQVQAERQRREELADLQRDLKPILDEMYEQAVVHLEEVSEYVQLEDVLRLVMRLLRHTRDLEQLLMQLESLQDLMRDVEPIVHGAMDVATEKLDEMDKKGYFAFMQEGIRILDNIVTGFSPEDVRLLADNIVLILNTVKQLTQPDVMQLLQELADTYREVERHPERLDISTFGLLRQMRDPEVRRGLALTMQMLRLISLNRGRLSATPSGNGAKE